MLHRIVETVNGPAIDLHKVTHVGEIQHNEGHTPHYFIYMDSTTQFIIMEEAATPRQEFVNVWKACYETN